MDECPSFRRRAGVVRLIVALLTPWLLGGVAFSLPLLEHWLSSGGMDTGGLRLVSLFWFYGFGFLAGLSVFAWFLFGVWRLVWRPEYRRSGYGWLWPVLMWLNLCLFGSVIH